MIVSEDTVMAYVDGELDPVARAEVAAAMLHDPELAMRIARQESVRSKVHVAFASVLDEPVPDRLLATVRTEHATQRARNVVPLRRQAKRRWSWPEWGAIAASLIVGILVSQILGRHTDSDSLTASNGQLVAGGILARALSDQLASSQTGQEPVYIGVSFQAKSGDYCRTFMLSASGAATTPHGALAGMACREGEAWHVQLAARSEQAVSASGPYKQAASSVPKSIMRAVDDSIAGEPLDEHGEADAKARAWTAKSK